MAKGRALQDQNRLTDALPIFIDLVENYSKTIKDFKIHNLALGRLYQQMGGTENLNRARDIFIDLRAQYTKGKKGASCNDKEIELALGRLYQQMGGTENLKRAQDIFIDLRAQYTKGKKGAPCKDKEVELALGRHYQLMGGTENLKRALDIFIDLCALYAKGKKGTPCKDKEVELALGRHYQLMGGTENLNRARDIFIDLRAQYTKGKKGVPCKDKEIELTLGRHYQLMGGTENLNRARDIFIDLRAHYTKGKKGAPCKDKEVELALGRLYQQMGGTESLNRAEDIFTDLRAQYTKGKKGASCNDKEIELTLGRHYQLMGGTENLKRALDIFIRLRNLTGHTEDICDNQEIELAIAGVYVELNDWSRFDQMQLNEKGFTGSDVDLLISVRYWRECTGSDQDERIITVLNKAIKHAFNAVNNSDCLDASSLSQLGHCFSLASALPFWKDPNDPLKSAMKSLSKLFYHRAKALDPNRKDKPKDEPWRKRQQEFLDRLAEQKKVKTSNNEVVQNKSAKLAVSDHGTRPKLLIVNEISGRRTAPDAVPGRVLAQDAVSGRRETFDEVSGR